MENENIILNSNEVDIIYNTIKNDYKVLLYGDSKPIFDNLKRKILNMSEMFLRTKLLIGEEKFKILKKDRNNMKLSNKDLDIKMLKNKDIEIDYRQLLKSINIKKIRCF